MSASQSVLLDRRSATDYRCLRCWVWERDSRKQICRWPSNSGHLGRSSGEILVALSRAGPPLECVVAAAAAEDCGRPGDLVFTIVSSFPFACVRLTARSRRFWLDKNLWPKVRSAHRLCALREALAALGEAGGLYGEHLVCVGVLTGRRVLTLTLCPNRRLADVGVPRCADAQPLPRRPGGPRAFAALSSARPPALDRCAAKHAADHVATAERACSGAARATTPTHRGDARCALEG